MSEEKQRILLLERVSTSGLAVPEPFCVCSAARSSLPDVTHERGGEQTPQSETGESLLLCVLWHSRAIRGQ